MRNKKKEMGICKLCKEEKELTFEHIPPRSANNKTTRFFPLTSEDYYKNAHKYRSGEATPNMRPDQGGIGKYSFCEDCNSFLGQKYVRTYKKFADIYLSVLQNNPEGKCYEVDISGVNILKFLKQIVAIFIAENDIDFTTQYPGLIEFVQNEQSRILADDYQIYMYLMKEGINRSGNVMYTNLYGNFCEFAFRPFGFVLSLRNEYLFPSLTNITALKNIDIVDIEGIFFLPLNKYSLNSQLPLKFDELPYK
ncbi:hypothetical protein LDL59_05030 [Kaistella anthropi]|nr:hypothetical protein [Kaistella anthropi]